MQFEWDENKASTNEAKHGVSFDDAIEVFSDPYAMEDIDVAHSTDDETRYTITGLASPGLLFVIYTEPQTDVIRIIHVRRAEKWMVDRYEQNKGRS